MSSMKLSLNYLFLFIFILTLPAAADEPIFYETLPLWAKMIIASVAFAIPSKIIFAHIGLFEFLDTDSFPKPPKLSKDQTELLAASFVGLVFGSFLTVIFILLS